MYRLIAAFFLFIAAFVPGLAHATVEDGDLALSRPCFLLDHPESNPLNLIKNEHAFDCARDPRSTDASTIWVRFDLSEHKIEGSVGWSYDHTLLQMDDERVWTLYADGRVRSGKTNIQQSRIILGGPTQRYVLSEEPGRITALLVRLDGLVNRRGPVPRASLTSVSAMSANVARYNLVFGSMGGAMFGILFYNLALFFALRYRVLIAYCGVIAASLFFGFIGSNAIFLIDPDMDMGLQLGWNVTAMALCFLASAVYQLAYLERDKVPVWLRRVSLGFVFATVLFALTRVWGQIMPWALFDRIIYTLFISNLILMLSISFIAWRRGSIAVRYYSLTWAFPLLMVATRIAWGLGLLRFENAVFDASPYYALCGEALLGAIAVAWRLRQLREQHDAALDRAETDGLTGLLNRRAFIERALGSEMPQRLVLIDIDHFKSINDCFGHVTGDDVLAHLGYLLRQHTPKDAHVGRLGGEEFGILVRADKAPTLAETLRDRIAQAEFPSGLKVTVSIGFAMAGVEDEPSWRRLYDAADKALYSAKHSGRNAVKGYGLPLAA